jgi:hypothetical protein
MELLFAASLLKLVRMGGKNVGTQIPTFASFAKGGLVPVHQLRESYRKFHQRIPEIYTLRLDNRNVAIAISELLVK